MQQGVFDKLRATRPGEDPTYRPIQLMSQLQYDLAMKAYREGHLQLGEKLPWEKSLEKVRMAYEILAYPHFEHPDIQLEVKDTIRDALEHPGVRTEEFPHRAPIALNDEEMGTLSKLTQAMELPFDPDKRVYRYAELAPLREAEHIVAQQSPMYKKGVQNAIDAGILRNREDVEERTRLRQTEWDVGDTNKPSGLHPPEPEK